MLDTFSGQGVFRRGKIRQQVRHSRGAQEQKSEAERASPILRRSRRALILGTGRASAAGVGLSVATSASGSMPSKRSAPPMMIPATIRRKVLTYHQARDRARERARAIAEEARIASLGPAYHRPQCGRGIHRSARAREAFLAGRQEQPEASLPKEIERRRGLRLTAGPRR